MAGAVHCHLSNRSRSVKLEENLTQNKHSVYNSSYHQDSVICCCSFITFNWISFLFRVENTCLLNREVVITLYQISSICFLVSVHHFKSAIFLNSYSKFFRWIPLINHFLPCIKITTCTTNREIQNRPNAATFAE